MAVDGAVKEKKKKKRKENELAVTAEDAGTKNMTKYQHASVQTTIKTEQSEVNICEVDQHEYKNAEKKKKKKKIKEEKVEENDIVVLCCDATVQTAVKTELLEMNISEGGLEKSDDLPRKEKKKKKKKKDKAEKVDGECLQESRIKKVKKKKDKQMEASVTESGELKKKKKKHIELKELVDVSHSEKINKKKKKKKKHSQDEEQNPESEDGEVKRKRKKADKHIKTEECTEEPTKKKKKKEKNASLKTENYEERVNGEKEKKVKNKKETLSPVEEEMNDINTEKKSKKKKKRLENLDEGQREGPAPVNRTKAKTGDVIEKISSKHQKKIKMEVDDVMDEELQENKIKQHKNKSTEKVKNTHFNDSDVMFKHCYELALYLIVFSLSIIREMLCSCQRSPEIRMRFL